MTFNQIYNLLKTTNINLKIATDIYPQKIPFMVLHKGEQKYEGADLVTLYNAHSPHIELYTKGTDYTSVDTLTKLLTSNNLLSSVTDEILISGEDIFVRYFYLNTQFDNL